MRVVLATMKVFYSIIVSPQAECFWISDSKRLYVSKGKGLKYKSDQIESHEL